MQCLIFQPQTELIRSYPFFHYQLAWLAGHGATQVILAYPGERIEEPAQYGFKLSHFVTPAADPAECLREAHARKLLERTFFFLSGKFFFPVDFEDLWREFRIREEPVLVPDFSAGRSVESGFAVLQNDLFAPGSGSLSSILAALESEKRVGHYRLDEGSYAIPEMDAYFSRAKS